MNAINTYLKYSSVIIIFSEIFRFHYVIDIKLFYVIILLNSLILIVLKSPKINIYHLGVITFLSIHGLLGVFMFKYPIQSLMAQILGITISSLYYYNLFKYFSPEELFKNYAYISFYVAVLGLCMFYLNITVWDPDRLHSILNEPSRFVIIVLPAFYYFFKNKKYFRFSLIGFTILLAQSSIGYLGMLLLIVLPNLKFKIIKKLIFLIPLLVVFIWFLSKNENFQIRYNETLKDLRVFETKKFSDRLNMSSYALLSNAYVSFNNFKDHPFGTGIGSYNTAYKYYISDLEKPSYIVKLGQDDLNSEDANSFFLRVLSDLGIFGLIVIIYFIFICFKSFNFSTYSSIIAQSLVIYFLLKLLRQGHYFPQEFYFFLWAFIFSMKKIRFTQKIQLSS